MAEHGAREKRQRVIAALRDATAAPAWSAAEDARARRRQLARMAWSLARIDELKRAQKAADAAWMKLVAAYDDWDEEEIPELDPPPEQAAVDAIFEEIHAVAEEDRWPAHLHWSV